MCMLRVCVSRNVYIYIYIYIHVQNNERVVKVGRSIEKVCHKFRMFTRGVNDSHNISI